MKSKARSKTAARPTHAIEVKAETDGVVRLQPTGFTAFVYTISCTHCGLPRPDIRFDADEQEVEGSRGTAHFVMSCKDCSHKCNVNYVSNFFETDCQDYSEWNRLMTLDCRGCAITEVQCDGWHVRTESGAVHEWDATDAFFEYDEDLGRPVTVGDLQCRVVSIK